MIFFAAPSLFKRDFQAKHSLTHATITSLTHAYVTYTCKGFRVGFRGGVVMTCAPHGNVARHSKDTSTCTLLSLETSGFRGGVSGWGFGVGFRGRVSGFRGGVSGWGPDDMRPAWKRGTPQQGHFHMHSPLFGDFRVSGWGFGVGSWWLFCTTKYLLRSALDPASWCLSQTTHVQATRTTHVQATQATHVQATVRPDFHVVVGHFRLHTKTSCKCISCLYQTNIISKNEAPDVT